MSETVVEVRGLSMRAAGRRLYEDIGFAVTRGEVFAIAGPSGCGKSTLLKAMVMLLPPERGRIRVLGQDIARLDTRAAQALRRRFGVMFQGGALFSGLTVLENVELPMKEYTDLDADEIRALAYVKLALADLPAESAHLYPRQLSGGMRKRAALARAIALDPELLFLDEPSAGLDPLAAGALDELILGLKVSLALTVILVTHDLDLLWRVADRVAVIGEGRLLALGTMAELADHPHPLVREYFHGPRGRATQLFEQRTAVWKRE